LCTSLPSFLPPSSLTSDSHSAINDEIKSAQDWLEEFAATASAEDYDERKEQLQSVVSPITSKLVRYLPSPPP
jgi:heat shock protein 5